MNITAQSLTASLSDIRSGFAFLEPELILILFFLLIVFLDLFKSRQIKVALPFLAFGGMALSFINQLYFLHTALAKQTQYFFTGLLINDGLALYAGLLFAVAGMLTIILSLLSTQLQLNFAGRGEYYAYLLVLLVGLNLMAKSVNLLMLFVALELVSIASYLLTTALKIQQQALESGLKYILYGTLASGIMLYGMSFLYGFGGSLSFTENAFWTNLNRLDSPFFLVIFLLTFSGFLFKVAAAPFHFWAPDVYEGAPAPAVALFATAPKIAGFVVIIRFLQQINNNVATTLQDDVMLLVGGIALLALTIGNFTALWQSRARRLLAYSSVAHAGFILAALAALASNTIEAVLFYLSVLLFMNFSMFLLIQVFEERLHIFDLKGLAGQGKNYPMLGVLAILILISLTGLPPTAGFTGKLLLFTNLWQNYTTTGNQLLLVLLLAGLLLTGVAFFYYIQIPYFLFFKRNFNPEKKVVLGRDNFVLALISLPLLVFFFQPAWLTELIRQVVLFSK